MFAAIVVPDFALQARLRHSPELRHAAVALIPEKVPKACIMQLTAPARALGVLPGMTPSQGLARCRELIVTARSPEAESSARAALFDCAWGISPFVEETGEGICTVALRGARKRDYDGWLEQLARLHLPARIGIAPHADLALLAAQSASTWREVHQARELSDVSMETLEAPPEMSVILEKWGIRTLGAFVALGRERLVERLGSAVLPLFDRAAGALERPLRCIVPPELFEESAEFEQEIETLEPLLFVLRRLLEQIGLRLEMIYRVVAELTLRFDLANGDQCEHVFKIPSPTRDLEVLFRTLHTRLENVHTEHPIVALHLMARPTRSTRQQFGLFESALRDPNQFYETLARLAALVGHERVGTPQLEATHRPDAFRMVNEAFQCASSSSSSTHTPAAGLLLRRFRPALPALVEGTPQPAFVHTREASGRVTALYGPMLLSGEWWNGRGWSRCEWDVQLADGLLCRIYEEEGVWFLEGVYD